MNNEFIVIPLTNENFENLIPSQSTYTDTEVNTIAKSKAINNLTTMCKIITDGSDKSVLQAFKNVIKSLNITIPPDFITFFNTEKEDILFTEIKDLISNVNFLLDLYQEFINQRNICLDSIKQVVLNAAKSDPSLFNIDFNSPNQKLEELVKNTIKSTCTNQKMLCPMIALSDAMFYAHLSFGKDIGSLIFGPMFPSFEYSKVMQNPTYNQRWFLVVIELTKNMEVIGFVMLFLTMYMGKNPLGTPNNIPLDPILFFPVAKKFLDETFINPLLLKICSKSDCNNIYDYFITELLLLSNRDKENMNIILSNQNFKNRIIKMFKMNSNTVTSFKNFYNNIFNIVNDNNAKELILKINRSDRTGIEENNIIVMKTMAELFYIHMLPVSESLVINLSSTNLECSSNNFKIGGQCIPHIILYIIIGVLGILVLLVIVKLIKKNN